MYQILRFSFVKSFFVLCLSCFIVSNSYSQENYKDIEKTLRELSTQNSTLNEKVTISVTNVSIQEFIRGVANSSGVNINIDPRIDIKVINNFTDVSVLDVLVFLCKEYHLGINVTGSIINIYKIKDEVIKRENVFYNSDGNLLTLDCQDELLSDIAKEITKQSGKNVILSNKQSASKVSGYVQLMPFDNALEKFALSNNMKVEKTEDGFYIIVNNPEIPEKTNSQSDKNSNKTPLTFKPGEFKSRIDIQNINNISVSAEAVPISALIKDVADKLGINYFIFSEIDGTVSLHVEHINFDDFLHHILKNTKLTYKNDGKIYLLGENKILELMDYKVIQLKYRSMEKIMEYIPADFTSDLKIKEFPDLNSLIIGGSPSRIAQVEAFITQIDKLVPLILIEVVLVDVSKTNTLTTGIQTGLGDAPKKSTGSAFPGIDLQLGSKTINDLLNSFNGFGSANLGFVAPNFYLTLKALEEQGVLDIKSTPKLATINGSKASLSIGNTQYYLEEQMNVYGSISTSSVKTQVYKSVNANLTVTITPFVSGDEQITLNIEVDQKDFTERISKTAPPGTVNRNFKSIIRVKNQDMILLGGLEQKRFDETSSGTPFLSRIPIVKWLFSSRTHKNTKSKLSIFIKPTIIN